MSICGIILIGGPQKGTRLRPLSLYTPKALFSFCGKTIIEHQIDALKHIKGLTAIYIVGNYDSTTHDFTIEPIDGIDIQYINEETLHGTAGCLVYLKNKNILKNSKTLIVCNCDIICQFPFDEVLEEMNKHASDVPRDVSKRFGCIISHEDRVVHYVEKPENHISDTIYAGVAFLRSHIFDIMAGISSESLTPFDLGDLFPKLAEKGLLYEFKLSGPWCSIKNPSSALYANSLVLQKFPLAYGPQIIGQVFIDKTAKIDPNAIIGPNVSIGPNSQVERGVRISNCILLNDCLVKANSLLKNSIICSNSTIGSWCRIEGKDHEDYFDYYRNAQSNYSHFSLDGKKHHDVTVIGSSVDVKNMVLIYNTIILPHREIISDCISEIIL